MINLNTPSDVLMKEMETDQKKAIFWMKKYYHGEKGYERMRDNLLMKCMETRQNQSSETIEYKSLNGNRWIVFEYAIYYPEVGTANCMPYAFCYYETYASIGAFVPGFSPDKYNQKMTSCIIYTSHFFERFCERLGVKMRSREMVKRFIECVPQQFFTFETLEKGEQVKFNVRLPGSVGRGFKRNDDFNIFEVRTFLTDKQLSNKQLRETEHVRKAGDTIKYEPEDVKMLRMIKSGNAIQTMYDEIKQYKDIGVDTRYMEAAVEISAVISIVFLGMNLAMPNDITFWKKHGEVNRQAVIAFSERYIDRPVGFSFFPEFVKLATESARRDGIRNFDKEEFIFQTLTKIYKKDDAKARQLVNNFGNVN